MEEGILLRTLCSSAIALPWRGRVGAHLCAPGWGDRNSWARNLASRKDPHKFSQVPLGVRDVLPNSRIAARDSPRARATAFGWHRVATPLARRADFHRLQSPASREDRRNRRHMVRAELGAGSACRTWAVGGALSTN